jgi:DNA polymerase-3 subunit gamma/tau
MEKISPEEVLFLSPPEMEEKKPYTALYRRWRPQLFSQVVGQEHVTRTLQNALASGRVAHAYLFCGLRGTGKTTMAKLLAKALNCLDGVKAEPCSRCRSCLEVTEGRNMDVLEIDAASNRGIDEIRDLREKARYAAAQNRCKVYIVDEVHMLTNEAFNALLKILEEPPPKVVFILATTEVYKLPLTVVSRCQRFDFQLLEVPEIARYLRDVSADIGFVVEEETLYLLARLAEGSMRDALGFLEQCRAYGGEKISYAQALEILGLTAPETIFNLLRAVVEEDIGGGLSVIQETVHRGRDLHRFLRELILYLRKLVLLQAGGDDEDNLKDVPGLKPYLIKQKDKFTSAVLLEMLEILQQLIYQLKGSSQPQFLLELAFLRLVRAYRFRQYLSPGALLSRLEDLEEKLQSAGLEGLAGRELLPPSGPGLNPGLNSNNKGENPAAGRSEPPSSAKTVFEEEFQASARTCEEKEAPCCGNSETRAPEAAPGIDPEGLQEFWDKQLLPEIKKQRKLNIHALLQEGRPISCREGIFTISFPPTHGIHKGRIESKEHRRYLESLLAQLLGTGVHIKVTLQENEKRAGVGGEAAEKKTNSTLKNSEEKRGDDFFIHQMLELFNGRLIETGGESLDSRDFWSFSLEEIGEPPEDEEAPF